ncbi:MAG: hypothetical protein ACR2JQ_06740, partial [Mycobacteriales bacterium]
MLTNPPSTVDVEVPRARAPVVDARARWRRARFLAPIAGGLLLVLAFPPYGAWPVAPVAVA